jgi:signal transduction histidine kinase/CheY-like chemotaxis protein
MQDNSFYTELWQTILSGKTWLGELQNKKKNGEIYWENAAISPVINNEGEITQFIAVKEDITQLKSTLTDLKIAKEKAEEANALKTEFLHNMSHEIRTPMNGIMGFSNLLCDLEGCSEIQKNYTAIIQNSSTQLLRIIDDILEISRLETKQLSIHNSEFDLNQFVMEIFAIYDLKSKERKIPLYVSKELSNRSCNIINDKTKLHKILCNLIDNAFKFTNSGRIEFGYTIKDSHIVFFVSDTGIGISANNQERIFKRFSQESSETAMEFGGLGLGLSIAKENAELLGGNITVNSEKGKGTTFYIEIPYKTNQDNANKNINTSESAKDDENAIQILIAEDEEVNYLYLEAILDNIADFNVELHHVINGDEAVKKCLKDDVIDIVLMDIKMPVMNGYIATEKIKEQKPYLPIIAQTAYSTTSERDLALKHGCDDFISKPIDKEKLLQLINTHLVKK